MQNLPLHVYSALQSSAEPEALLQSFQKYLSATYNRHPAPLKVTPIDNESALHYFAGEGDVHGALCLIPSIINGAEVFDLTEEYSFIRYLTGQGVDVYLLDWGDLSGNVTITLKALIETKFGRFFELVQNQSSLPINVLGYCLGGTLTASFFAQQTSLTPQSITFLAAPFDFQAEGVSWQSVLSDPETIKREIRLQGGLSQRMLQSYFLYLNPEFTEQKFKNFLNAKTGSAEEKRFIAVEHWLNEGNDLPAQLALDVIDTYFIDQVALKDIQQISHPNVCMVTSTKDQIVAAASSNILKKFIPNITHIETHCGHVGMMAGSNARETVWQPFLKFLKSMAAQQR